MHRVLMNFMNSSGGWYVSFLEADCKTSLPLKLNFAKADKILIMHERFGSPLLEDRHAVDHGIEIGRGSSWLTLNAEQYAKLKRR